MPPPPAATFVAFYPQDNNIVAIGIDDSSIHIYNVRVDEVVASTETYTMQLALKCTYKVLLKMYI